jgi:hypothetical protein
VEKDVDFSKSRKSYPRPRNQSPDDDRTGCGKEKLRPEFVAGRYRVTKANWCRMDEKMVYKRATIDHCAYTAAAAVGKSIVRISICSNAAALENPHILQ